MAKSLILFGKFVLIEIFIEWIIFFFIAKDSIEIDKNERMSMLCFHGSHVHWENCESSFANIFLSKTIKSIRFKLSFAIEKPIDKKCIKISESSVNRILSTKIRDKYLDQ